MSYLIFALFPRAASTFHSHLTTLCSDSYGNVLVALKINLTALHVASLKSGRNSSRPPKLTVVNLVRCYSHLVFSFCLSSFFPADSSSVGFSTCSDFCIKPSQREKRVREKRKGKEREKKERGREMARGERERVGFAPCLMLLTCTGHQP